MKISHICPKCSKGSPPLEVKGNEEYKFCPYCGAPYREEAKGACRVSSMRSEIITAPGETEEMVKKMFEAVSVECGSTVIPA